ncbi:hypothetical protein N781_11385 [Pontibacillus halophilus JSM 076056 = DSM 19796]|uniref:DUF4305 domain-containing protein n=1 Tax=Pontibacillus halophilus JSM 076056 = DSM 19796 TaxID=1385510 RepID=A0A0A5G5E1_9BACI|nr:YdiK family protein [Pontibacillus halophilus]KGX88346.1 hypothetical protein N781_11385 [Pontibacillus halophilus JSM 076056 = DSM 19796]
MKTSPLVMAWIYFIVGVLFTFIASLSAGETIFNFTTMLFAIIATLNFAVTVRLFNLHRKIKQQQNKK